MLSYVYENCQLIIMQPPKKKSLPKKPKAATQNNQKGAEDTTLVARLTTLAPDDPLNPSRSESALFGGELFHTPDGDGYAHINRETWPIRTKAFRQWLRLKAYGTTGKAPSQAELSRQIELLDAWAVDLESPEREVHIRAACAGGHVYIDLADTNRSVVEIGPDGWSLIQNPPVRFIRPPGMLPLPRPRKGGSIETLRGLVNLQDDSNFILLVAWLLDALRNESGHPVLVLGGAAGTAKSTLMEFVQALVDPNYLPPDGLPRADHKLVDLAKTRYLLPADNVSEISQDTSNTLCRLATGTNAHPIIVNSMNELVTQPDLADRCVFVTCDFISDTRRRSGQQLRAEFMTARPQIIGLLLDALSQGLRMLPMTRPTAIPRMADFAIWATACETAFWPAGTFATAYADNRAAAVEKLIEADPVASAVHVLMANRKTWNGTATKLFVTLAPTFAHKKGNIPASPRDLGAKLRKAATPLSNVGITIDFDIQGHNRDRIIKLYAERRSQRGS